MKKVDFILTRDLHTTQTVLGTMTYPNGRVDQTLEDTCRAWGIKVKGYTAIPVGKYRMTVSMSTRFKREMVMIYSETNQYELKAGGISFKGIRAHGGNTHKHTDGCIIIAKKRVGNDGVQGSTEAEFTAVVKDYIKKGHEVFLTVKNLHQPE